MNDIKFYSQIEMNTEPSKDKHLITKEYLESILENYSPGIGSQEYIIADENDNEVPLTKRLKFVNGDVFIDGNTVIVDTSKSLIFPNMAKVFEFIGDDDTLDYVFSHDLNSKNIICTLYNIDTGKDVVANFIRIDKDRVEMILETPLRSDSTFSLIVYNPAIDILIDKAPDPVKVWGIRIDTKDSNPATACKYIESLSPPPADFGERPCLFKDGKVNYYIDPNDFTKRLDGRPADIITGNDGNVMIEIPKLAFYIENVGDFTEIRLTNSLNAEAIDSRYKYLGHTREIDGDRNKLYIGAYQACEISSKLCSLSGRTPLGNNTITVFRTKAQANGAGYSLTAFNTITLLQIMYLIKYGRLDSQLILGQGVTTGTASIATGGTEKWGMYGGTQNTREHVKFAGIEDFYGNLWDRIDGCYTGADYTFFTGTDSFNDTNVGYKNQGKWLSANVAGAYLKKPHGDTEKGFLPPDGTGGSSTTYYSDYIYYYNSCVGGFFGGCYGNAAGAGAFCLHLGDPASNSHARSGARLMFL